MMETIMRKGWTLSSIFEVGKTDEDAEKKY